MYMYNDVHVHKNVCVHDYISYKCAQVQVNVHVHIKSVLYLY